MISLSTIASGGIVAAVIAGWNYIKSFYSKIVSIVIKTDCLQSNAFDEYWIEHILANSKKLYFGNKKYGTYYCYFKPKSIYGHGIFEIPPNGFYLYNKNLIFVNFDKLTISSLRGTFDFDLFLKQVSNLYFSAIDEYLQSENDSNNFYIDFIQGKSKKDVFSSGRSSKTIDVSPARPDSSFNSKHQTEPRNWSNLPYRTVKYLRGINFEYKDIGEGIAKKDIIFFDKQALYLLKVVKTWYRNRKWFKERGILHRRGALVYGPPGSGKSQTIKEICRKAGVPLFIFDLNTLNDQEFHEEFSQGVATPCVILFEDIDAIFNGRENIKNKEDGISFDTFINHLGGAIDNEGRFIIITTNHPEKLDPALIRSGRLDEKIEIGPLSQEAKEFIANKILKDFPEEKEKVLKENEREILGADFENICVKVAVEKFWENQQIT